MVLRPAISEHTPKNKGRFIYVTEDREILDQTREARDGKQKKGRPEDI